MHKKSTYNPDIHHRRSIRLKGYDYSSAGLYFITICCQNRISRFGHIENGTMILNEFGMVANDEWLNTPNIRKNIQLGAFRIMPNHMHGIIQIMHEAKLNSSENEEKLHKPNNDGKLHSPTSTGELHSPQSIELNSLQSIKLLSPQRIELNSPQSIKMHSPQSIELNSLQSIELLSPQSIELNSPQSIELNSLQSIKLLSPQSIEFLSPQNIKMHSPQSIKMHSLQSIKLNPSDNKGVCKTPRLHPQSPSQTIGAIIRGYKSSVTKQLRLLGLNDKLWQRNYHEHIIRNEKAHENISNYIINNPAKWDNDKFYN